MCVRARVRIIGVCACVRVCVRACVRAYARACVRARACVCVCVRAVPPCQILPGDVTLMLGKSPETGS